MKFNVQKVVVIGAGWMGSSIAAFLASAKFDVYLLDLLCPEDSDTATVSWRRVLGKPNKKRSRYAFEGIAQALQRGDFLNPAMADVIHFGNIADSMKWVERADWIIEAAPEVLNVKQDIYAMLDEHTRLDTIVTSTSAAFTLKQLMQNEEEEFSRQFMLTRFFPPMRHTRLIELVAPAFVDNRVKTRFTELLEDRIGRNVHELPDIPAGFANRLLMVVGVALLNAAKDSGLSLAEAEMLSAQVFGNGENGVLTMLDRIGLDNVLRMLEAINESSRQEGEAEAFKIPRIIYSLNDAKQLGLKVGQGFLKRSASGKLLLFNEEKWRYEEVSPVPYSALPPNPRMLEFPEKLRKLIDGDSVQGRFIESVLLALMKEAMSLLARHENAPLRIDRALRWSYGFSFGPFELFDKLGFESVFERLAESLGDAAKERLQTIQASDESNTWYDFREGKRYQFSFRKHTHTPTPQPSGVIDLNALGNDRILHGKAGDFALYDIGQAIACLKTSPFRQGGMRVDESYIDAVQHALNVVGERGYKGLILFLESTGKTGGMDLPFLLQNIEAGDWTAIEEALKKRQQMNSTLKRSRFPVVCTLADRMFGAGLELALHAGRIQAHVGLVAGLNHVHAGLIPAGGGCKEMLYRHAEKSRLDGPFPPLRGAFDTIFPAAESKNAFEAKEMTFIRRIDFMTMGAHRLLTDAKALIQNFHETGYSPPINPPLNLPGEGGATWMTLELLQMQREGKATEHDLTIGKKLAHVLAGGNCSPRDTISEQWLLDLEREAFLSLCGMEKTKERILHLVKMRRPLHN